MVDREAIFDALLAKVTGAPCVVAFTADVASGSAALANVSDTTNLVAGMPVWGPGVRDGAVLATVTPDVTMSLPASATHVQASLTQGFRTSGRRRKHWQEVAAQPALYVVAVAERWPGRATGIPAAVVIEAEIWIYSDAGKNPDVVPDTVLNALIGAVETALAPTPVFTGIAVQNAQTLGGLVEHCWIEGDLEKAPGDLEGQALAVIPVLLLVPQ